MIPAQHFAADAHGKPQKPAKTKQADAPTETTTTVNTDAPTEKPKKVITAEHLAKMKAAREAKKALKNAQ